MIRTWGGAVLANQASGDPPAFVRWGANLYAKKKIALAATELIKDSMSLFLASGTTVTELSKLLFRFRDLTVITNGLDIINALHDHDSVNIIVPGGELYEHYDFTGTIASNNVSKFSTDIFMFSCSGITTDGITLNDSKRLDMIQRMHENAKKTVLLIDTGKAGTQHTYKGFSLDEIDYVVMEKKPADNALVAKLGKKLIVPHKM